MLNFLKKPEGENPSLLNTLISTANHYTKDIRDAAKNLALGDVANTVIRSVTGFLFGRKIDSMAAKNPQFMALLNFGASSVLSIGATMLRDYLLDKQEEEQGADFKPGLEIYMIECVRSGLNYNTAREGFNSIDIPGFIKTAMGEEAYDKLTNAAAKLQEIDEASNFASTKNDPNRQRNGLSRKQEKEMERRMRNNNGK